MTGSVLPKKGRRSILIYLILNGNSNGKTGVPRASSKEALIAALSFPPFHPVFVTSGQVGRRVTVCLFGEKTALMYSALRIIFMMCPHKLIVSY